MHDHLSTYRNDSTLGTPHKMREVEKCYIPFMYLRSRVNNSPIHSIMNIHSNKGEHHGTS